MRLNLWKTINFLTTTQNFGVWTGNGPGRKDYSISMGALVDFANSHPGAISNLNGGGANIQLTVLAQGNKSTIFGNPLTGKLTISTLPQTMEELGNADGARAEWTDFGNAQSGGGAESYPGMITVETSAMPGGAVTLPPVMITTPGGADKDTKRHEHGHVLQYVALSLISGGPITGYGLYLLGVGAPSILSAANNDPSHIHQQTYTEKTANQLSYWFQGMPSDWNHADYPVYKK